MDNKMTVVSQQLYNQAISRAMTASEAIDFLEREAKMRTLREKLERFSHGQELKSTLVQGLMQNHANQNKESVERRVRGWLNNPKNQTLRKKDAIELCFILKLSVEEADALVALISEEGLHWRNPDEIVYIFALKQGMDYSEAQKLNDEMAGILSGVTESGTPAENSFTPLIRSEVTALRTREELIDYLTGAVSRLGRYHNNAYRLFMEMMKALENPLPDEGEENAGLFEKEELMREELTIRDILREYLYEKNVLYAKGLIQADKKKDKKSPRSEEERLVFTVIQEEVSRSWPDETTISKMKSRKADVTRKVLILLFLATEQEPEDEDEDYALSKEEIFETLYQCLNDLLLQCGFMPLDPRSPFDWLILYCICAVDMFDMNIRMRTVFKEMFGERPPKEEQENDKNK
ncbi:MAG: hypothetical protein K2I96_04740 [Lachnospiraceae bacterium]|nr:hypothetical protein [Lachnospiraceae bacterium]